jgi:rhamnosyltransferase
LAAADSPPLSVGHAAATAAVLVVHGEAGALADALKELAARVARVVVVDNNEAPSAELAELAGLAGIELLHHGNRGGLAGAYNRALRHLREPASPAAPAPRQIVFVDQDSDPAVLGAFLADPEVNALLARDDVAAVAPAYRDRATGLRARYIELGRWRLQHLPREFEGLRRVAFVVNSMSAWRVQALARLGDFDEQLAIDHVDTEHGLRARRQGLSVWVHGSHVFAHSIGQRRRYRLFGRELQATGHGPARRRLIGRNTVLLLRRWGLREPAFARLCLLRLAYEAVGIVLAEDRRLRKLGALLAGAGQGLVGRSRR